jgi:hypothetical protein
MGIFPSGWVFFWRGIAADGPFCGTDLRGTEPACRARQENLMMTSDRRLVVDQDFDRTVETVLDAFLNAGFSVAPIDGGDLHQKGESGGRLRYALLEATLPELSFVRAACRRDLPLILGCRISVYEVTGSCTFVTASNPLTRYPLLASLVPRLSERTRAALGLVALHGAGLEAA